MSKKEASEKRNRDEKDSLEKNFKKSKNEAKESKEELKILSDLVSNLSLNEIKEQKAVSPIARYKGLSWSQYIEKLKETEDGQKFLKGLELFLNMNGKTAELADVDPKDRFEFVENIFQKIYKNINPKDEKDELAKENSYGIPLQRYMDSFLLNKEWLDYIKKLEQTEKGRSMIAGLNRMTRLFVAGKIEGHEDKNSISLTFIRHYRTDMLRFIKYMIHQIWVSMPGVRLTVSMNVKDAFGFSILDYLMTFDDIADDLIKLSNTLNLRKGEKKFEEGEEEFEEGDEESDEEVEEDQEMPDSDEPLSVSAPISVPASVSGIPSDQPVSQALEPQREQGESKPSQSGPLLTWLSNSSRQGSLSSSSLDESSDPGFGK